MKEFIIGVDADGVLTDLYSFYIREGKKYLNREPSNINGYDLKELFNITKKEECKYGLTILNKYCKKEQPRPYATEAIAKLNKQNCELHEITARKFTTEKSLIGKYYRYLFEKWLKKNNFNFKSIEYCSEENSPRDKFMACSKLNVDIMIEDKPDIALYLAENNIKVLLMDAPYNKALSHNNIIRVLDWKDVLSKINILCPKRKEIKESKFVKASIEEKLSMNDEQKIVYFKKYHSYLKNLTINKKKINRGRRIFNIIYNISYLPVKLIYNPKVRNKEYIPFQDGFIIASNHLNSKDQYLISCALGNRYYAGFAASTIKNTLRGRLFNLTKGAVFINRNDSESKKNGEEELASRVIYGNNILIFPEGTRKNKTEEGKLVEQLPFKMGSVAIAQKTGTPILPTSIYYGKKHNYVKFGELFFVKATDNLQMKNKELENIILNMTRESKQADIEEKNKK